jgi:hypothetical protein
MNVCHALTRIGSRHSQPDANIADGAGSTNCSISNTRTTISQITKIPMITIQGRMWRSALRRSRYGLRGRTGGVSSSMSAVTTRVSRLRLPSIGPR